jgi:hypothetical protein
MVVQLTCEEMRSSISILLLEVRCRVDLKLRWGSRKPEDIKVRIADECGAF